MKYIERPVRRQGRYQDVKSTKLQVHPVPIQPEGQKWWR